MGSISGGKPVGPGGAGRCTQCIIIQLLSSNWARGLVTRKAYVRCVMGGLPTGPQLPMAVSVTVKRVDCPGARLPLHALNSQEGGASPCPSAI